MVEAILVHPDFQGLRRIALWTSSAERLYDDSVHALKLPTSTYMELRPGPGPQADGSRCFAGSSAFTKTKRGIGLRTWNAPTASTSVTIRPGRSGRE